MMALACVSAVLLCLHFREQDRQSKLWTPCPLLTSAAAIRSLAYPSVRLLIRGSGAWGVAPLSGHRVAVLSHSVYSFSCLHWLPWE